MAQLYSTVSEALAIKTLCSPSRELGGKLLSLVDSDHFYTDECSEAFERIIGVMNDTGAPPTFTLLCEDLKLSAKARKTLKLVRGTVRSDKQLDDLITTLGVHRKARKLLRIAKGIARYLDNDAVDIEDLVSVVQNKASELSLDRSVENTLFHIGRDYNMEEHVRSLIYDSEIKNVIPTGFKTFDSVNAGFVRGGVVLLGGATGSGKSLLAGQIAMNQALMGYKVAFVPLEMGVDEITGRYIANIAGIENTSVQFKRLATGEKDLAFKRWKRFNRKVLAANGRLSFFEPSTDVTIQQTFASLHALNCDSVIIDYVSLLSGTDGDDQWRALNRITRYAKVYGKSTNKSIVLLVQITDDLVLRYSKSMAEHASTTWFFAATKESREQGFLRIHMTKARNQRLMDFSLGVNYGHQRVYDLSPAEAEEAEGAAPAKRETKGQKSDDDAYLPDLTSE